MRNNILVSDWSIAYEKKEKYKKKPFHSSIESYNIWEMNKKSCNGFAAFELSHVSDFSNACAD